MILFFDTETTGLPDWRAPSDAPHQPHICQIAALLMDAGGGSVAEFSTLILPEGWVIADDAAKIHGITTERAAAGGIRAAVAMAVLRDFVARASQVVAHNVDFDVRMVRIAHKRLGFEWGEGLPTFCTMRAATPVVNLPPTEKMVAAGFKKAKSATLSECMQHFFGEPHDKAHDALADVRACARVFWHLHSFSQPITEPGAAA